MRWPRSQGQTPSQKPNRAGMLLLFCVCLGVWGYGFYQVTGRFQQGGAGPGRPADAGVRTTPFSALPDLQASYDTTVRDPFARPVGLFPLHPDVSGKRIEPPPEPREPVLRPLVLHGVIGETALLQGADGSAHIVRVGGRPEGVQILAVRHDHIVVQFQDRLDTLHLQSTRIDAAAGL